MRVVETIAECRAALSPGRRTGRRIGFVPTMGYLHDGHLSLVDLARTASQVVVMSIFVNPSQFGSGDDYENYPRDTERDLTLAEERGVDLVFVPSVGEMYPDPALTVVTMRGITEGLEGAARPGHFDGVLTVVAKLFHIVHPEVAVFGQKDAQQAAAVKRMVAELDFPIEILVGPTVRDSDGLALSSRNVHLGADERRQALALSRAVRAAADLVASGERDAARVEAAMRTELARSPALEIDYAAVADRERFTPVDTIGGPCVAVVAARIGRTRLIDSALLDPHDD